MLAIIRFHDLNCVDAACGDVTAILSGNFLCFRKDILTCINDEHAKRILAQGTKGSPMAAVHVVDMCNDQYATFVSNCFRPRFQRLDSEILPASAVGISWKIARPCENPLDRRRLLVRWENHQQMNSLSHCGWNDYVDLHPWEHPEIAASQGRPRQFAGVIQFHMVCDASDLELATQFLEKSLDTIISVKARSSVPRRVCVRFGRPVLASRRVHMKRHRDKT
jgi:hypothetical protein